MVEKTLRVSSTFSAGENACRYNDINDMIDIFVDVEVCAEVGVDKTSATKYLATDCLVTA